MDLSVIPQSPSRTGRPGRCRRRPAVRDDAACRFLARLRGVVRVIKNLGLYNLTPGARVDTFGTAGGSERGGIRDAAGTQERRWGSRLMRRAEENWTERRDAAAKGRPEAVVAPGGLVIVRINVEAEHPLPPPPPVTRGAPIHLMNSKCGSEEMIGCQTALHHGENPAFPSNAAIGVHVGTRSSTSTAILQFEAHFGTSKPSTGAAP
jgi:hypothetical protein